MTLFWSLATALVVVVMLTLLRPLLRPPTSAVDDTAESNRRLLRDQLAELDAELAGGRLAPEQHAAARAELERRVLDETRVADTPAAPLPSGSGRLTALAMAVLLPASAVLLYLQLGSRDALDPVLAQAPAEATEADIETLIQRLADRMQAAPEDPEGWVLLGRSYAGLQRFELARDAFAQAVQRSPPNAQLLADYADVLAMTQGRTLQGEPERLILRALTLDPVNLKALALAGSAAMERGDYAKALEHWTLARSSAPPDSPFATQLDPAIAEARAAGGLPAAAGGPVAPLAPAAASAAATAGLRVTVAVAPELAARVQPGDTLFVFARAAEGPRMPLAITRQPAGVQTVEVVLDDASAMTPQMRLSAFSQVVVGARISRSGNATPQPGDLEGLGEPMPPSGAIRLVIDQVRP
jgi:cytochrome c-type biogenesis protein CcmH